MMTEEEIIALRAIYPEIPKNIKSITITSGFDAEVEITCTFYPNRELRCRNRCEDRISRYIPQEQE